MATFSTFQFVVFPLFNGTCNSTKTGMTIGSDNSNWTLENSRLAVLTDKRQLEIDIDRNNRLGERKDPDPKTNLANRLFGHLFDCCQETVTASDRPMVRFHWGKIENRKWQQFGVYGISILRFLDLHSIDGCQSTIFWRLAQSNPIPFIRLCGQNWKSKQQQEKKAANAACGRHRQTRFDNNPENISPRWRRPSFLLLKKKQQKNER